MRQTRWGTLVSAGALALTGCNIYYGGSHGSGDDQPWGTPDAPTVDAYVPPFIDAAPPAPPTYTFATCVNGQLLASGPQSTDTPPADLAKTGTAFAQCDSRCRAPTGVYDCQGDPSCAGAQAWLCEPDFACPADGACSPNGAAVSCQTALDCVYEVTTEQCTCANGQESCASPCNDGLCTPLDVLHAVAGHWRGTVTPPSFAPPYQVDFVIAPDGHVTPTSLDPTYTALYYGSDGADPNRWFNITAETPTGATGYVGVLFSPQEILPGLFTGLQVQGDRLTFTFWDSWLECGERQFDYDLTRVP